MCIESASSWFNAERTPPPLPGWHHCQEGLKGVALFLEHFACTFWNGKKVRRHEQVRLDLGTFWPLWQERDLGRSVSWWFYVPSRVSKQLAKFHSGSRKWTIFRFIPRTTEMVVKNEVISFGNADQVGRACCCLEFTQSTQPWRGRIVFWERGSTPVYAHLA